MRKKLILVLVVALFMFSMTKAPQASGYSSEIAIGSTIEWHVDGAPNDAFNMFYTGGGDWVAENGSSMTLSILNVGEDVGGRFELGNVTVIANDTEIAKDLTLGVWGTPTEWWPGLIVDVGQFSIESLNATAYASAERISGNYLNGTMTSHYENISVGNVLVECIVFDYEQDPSGFGEPQVTHLAYELGSGVLVEGRTSYSFGVPYNLEISLVGTGTPIVTPISELYLVLLTGALIAVVIVVYVIISRRS
ncbi:MAG: hypothetical protein KGD60_07890 [Candidatus Thorarchaeota archaeon]|nr:hypothetical protein [Candidatus Thorarchaeota archaeon]